jgi:hypothetical protein
VDHFELELLEGGKFGGGGYYYYYESPEMIVAGLKKSF